MKDLKYIIVFLLSRICLTPLPILHHIFSNLLFGSIFPLIITVIFGLVYNFIFPKIYFLYKHKSVYPSTLILTTILTSYLEYTRFIDFVHSPTGQALWGLIEVLIVTIVMIIIIGICVFAYSKISKTKLYNKSTKGLEHVSESIDDKTYQLNYNLFQRIKNWIKNKFSK